MGKFKHALANILVLLTILALCSGLAFAAGIRVVPSASSVVPGSDFSFDVVAEGIPADGLGGVQFRLTVSLPNGLVSGVTDLSQGGSNEIAVASPLLISPSTATRSGIGVFFWNGRSDNGILVMDNETLTNSTALYTFAHTSGSTPPVGSGAIARFMVRVGAGVNPGQVDISLSDVLLLDGGPAYPLDYNTGSSVQLRCMTAVPSLLGLSLGQAQAALIAANLALGNVYEINNATGNLPLNVVVEQSATSGSSASCQNQINVAINIPPAEITQAAAIDKPHDGTGAALLSWTPSISGDVAGYRIYTGATVLQEIKSPSATGTEVGGLPNGTTTSLRVTTYDTHGNESPGVMLSALPIADLPPVISGTPATGVTAGNAYSFTPTASNATSFSIAGKPTWASFNTATGALTGTPSNVNAGPYSNIIISATNSSGTTPLPAFSITVALPMPTISGSPATIGTVGNAYSFTPMATNATSFGITGKPSWASFNTATGALTGIPTTIGTSSTIIISASNARGTASLPAFSLTVYPGANVTVTPTPTVTFTFNSLTSLGSVTAATVSTPSTPANFRVLTGASYEINTTAAFDGLITVCLDYSDAALADSRNESSIRMFHHNGQRWDDITTSVDTVNNRVCGMTNSLSPFMIGEPLLLPTARVPVMNGWWLLPAMLAGIGIFARRRKE